MVEVEDKEEMRKLYFRRHWSIRRIARELHCSRKTVRRALSDSDLPKYKRRIPPPERVIAPVKHIIDGYLEEDQTAPRKQADVGKNLLSRVNRVVTLLKHWLLGTYQGGVHPSHLDYYLDEFIFRFNRRTSRSRGKLFCRLVQQAVAVDPVLAKDIKGEHFDRNHSTQAES